MPTSNCEIICTLPTPLFLFMKYKTSYVVRYENKARIYLVEAVDNKHLPYNTVHTAFY